MRKLTNEMLEEYLKYITGFHIQRGSYCYNTINSSIKREHWLKEKRNYEIYKKSISFIDKNFSSIVSGLQSEDIFIKKECAKVLGCFYDKRSVNPLISSLKYSNRAYRSVCINSLVKIRKCSTESLINALTNPNKNIRRGAIAALRQIPEKEHIKLYFSLLDDKDWVLRYNAIDLLISIVPPNAIDSICKLMVDNSARVRTKAIWAMKYLYYLNSIYNLNKNLDIREFTRCYSLINDSILMALKDENGSVRKQVMILLKNNVDFNVYSSIIPHLEKLSDEISKDMSSIQDLDKDIYQLVDDIKSNTNESNQFSEKTEKLTDMLKLRKNLLESAKMKSDTVSNFLEVSKKYDNDHLRVHIENVLNDKNSKVREYAIILLSRIGGHESIPLLKESFNDKNPHVRKTVIKSLDNINDKNSIIFIKEALNDENKLVRDKAEFILRKHQDTHEWNTHRTAYILEDASIEELESYNLWLSHLNKSNPLNFKDNQNYIYMFLYETVSKFSENKKMKYLIANFDLIENSYPDNIKLHQDLNNWRSGAYFSIEKYEKSFFYKKKAGLDLYNDLFFFAPLLKPSQKDLVNGEIILKMGQNNLTFIGKKYLNEIILAIDELLKEKHQKYGKHLISHFTHDFIYCSSKDKTDQKSKNTFNYISISLSCGDLESLRKYFDNEEEFNELKFQYLRGERGLLYGSNQSHSEDLYFRPFPSVLSKNYYLNSYDLAIRVIIPNIIIKAFIYYSKKLVRKAENKVRKTHNLPEVGKKWINETVLFNELKLSFPDEIIIHHGKPSWLGQQHLDIFFPNKNIGIEYQGQQHLEPVDYFGGEKAFKELQKRDKLKKRLCDKNNCKIIYIYPRYNILEVKEKIKNLIDVY